MKAGPATFGLEANSHLHATGNALNLLRKVETGWVNGKCHQQTQALSPFLLVFLKQAKKKRQQIFTNSLASAP